MGEGTRTIRGGGAELLPRSRSLAFSCIGEALERQFFFGGVIILPDNDVDTVVMGYQAFLPVKQIKGFRM